MDIENDLEIFTDASGARGFGILFINPDETERQYSYKITNKELHKYFNVRNKTHTYLTSSVLELFAIYVSIKKLNTYSTPYDKVIINTDSDSAYQFLNELVRSGKKRQNIRLPKNSTDRAIVVEIKRMMKEFNIEIRHIKAHCGVYGNEIADRLAKKGNEGSNFYTKIRRRDLDVFYESLFKSKKVLYIKNEKFPEQMKTSYVNQI